MDCAFERSDKSTLTSTTRRERQSLHCVYYNTTFKEQSVETTTSSHQLDAIGCPDVLSDETRIEFNSPHNTCQRQVTHMRTVIQRAKSLHFIPSRHLDHTMKSAYDSLLDRARQQSFHNSIAVAASGCERRPAKLQGAKPSSRHQRIHEATTAESPSIPGDNKVLAESELSYLSLLSLVASQSDKSQHDSSASGRIVCEGAEDHKLRSTDSAIAEKASFKLIRARSQRLPKCRSTFV